MSDTAVEIVDVEPGVDPLPRFEAAWSRGARVLPLGGSLPAAVRDYLAAVRGTA